MEPELSATPLRDDKTPAKSPGRKSLPAHLPRIEVRHEVPAIERICGCGSGLQEIGDETSEQLDIIPAKIQVIRHVRPKYACGRCHTGVKIMPVPVLAIPMKRFEQPLVGFLSREHIEAILAAPDGNSWTGQRDRVMLTALYNTGARVSELIGMRVSDLQEGAIGSTVGRYCQRTEALVTTISPCDGRTVISKSIGRAYSADVGHRFQLMSAIDSGACRLGRQELA